MCSMKGLMNIVVGLSVHSNNSQNYWLSLNKTSLKIQYRGDAHITGMLLCDDLSWGYGPLLNIVLIFIT